MTLTNKKFTKIRQLIDEGDKIAAGKIGFPRCVEWQADFVKECYEYFRELRGDFDVVDH